jgi:D-arabinose 1-dehydrogenase-like Zn-dependent alcohol dehydrogenase
MTSLGQTQPRALVSYGPHKSGGWKVHPVTVRRLREKELLVEIVASGICQTDLHFAGAESGFGVHYPRVMGHEGMYHLQSVFVSLFGTVVIATVADVVDRSWIRS